MDILINTKVGQVVAVALILLMALGEDKEDKEDKEENLKTAPVDS